MVYRKKHRTHFLKGLDFLLYSFCLSFFWDSLPSIPNCPLASDWCKAMVESLTSLWSCTVVREKFRIRKSLKAFTQVLLKKDVEVSHIQKVRISWTHERTGWLLPSARSNVQMVQLQTWEPSYNCIWKV